MPIVSEPILFSANSETIPPDEAADMQQAVVALRQLMQQALTASGERLRGVHAKTHGCARGSLRVLPNLPPELAHGLFAREATYDAIVRFSNAAPLPQADALPDARGLAVKVLNIPGSVLEEDAETGPAQDFVAVNHPVFFAANVKELARLEQALVEARDKPLAAMKEALVGDESNPFRWHWRELLTAASTATHIPAHLARYTYFSMSPVRFGRHVAKYRFHPAGELSTSRLETIGRLAGERDALRLLLEETLRTESMLFEFQVQLQTSPETMPIEDASVEWPESESPYRTVGLLLLPRQEIATPELRQLGERLSFNVWHSSPEHQPLGGINRLRRVAYPASVGWRR